MSYYLNQEYDFVERTKKILKRYSELEINKQEKFEITLMLNCFTGLLILPQQHWFNNLPETIVDEQSWGIKPQYISLIEGDYKSIKEVTRHLRNSLTHYRFTVFSNKKNEISSIKFIDKNRADNITFTAEIPIRNIQIFLDKFSSWFLDEMKK